MSRERKDKYKRLSREGYRRKKAELKKKLGNKCKECGYDKFIEILEFHHREGKKEHSKDYLRKDYDLSKIELLCPTHHREKDFLLFGRIGKHKVIL